MRTGFFSVEWMIISVGLGALACIFEQTRCGPFGRGARSERGWGGGGGRGGGESTWIHRGGRMGKLGVVFS